VIEWVNPSKMKLFDAAARLKADPMELSDAFDQGR
jgi:hypothetical protein